ncbi:MAG: DUF4843 domain-containing protein, partial [Bacteroidetes bacterium]|nr:DUF4843 domain-containing protein [Bacteroidota bacterium]
MALLAVALSANSQSGTLDQDFGSNGYTITAFPGGGAGFHALTLQSDGKLIAVGDEHRNGSPSFAIARYNTSGKLDASFGNAGLIVTDFEGGDDRARAITIQPDGSILVAGYAHNGSNYNFALVRYLSNGSLDSSFGDDGKVRTPFVENRNAFGRAVDLQENGKIVVAGEAYNGTDLDFAIARYNHNGRPDSSWGDKGIILTDFSQGSSDKARAVAVQADGKVVVAGVTNNGTGDNFALVRYQSNGQLDGSFGSGGKVITDFSAGPDEGRSLHLLSDGGILLAGEAYNGSNQIDFALARYRSDGSLDTSFGNGGKVTTPVGAGDDPGRAVAVQGDGRILVAGEVYSNGLADVALVRYQANGSLDNSFGTHQHGKVVTAFSEDDDVAYAIALSEDRLFIAGHVGADANTERGLVAAYTLAEPVKLSVAHSKDATEDDIDGEFVVTISAAQSQDLNINFELTGTATPGTDYEAPEQPLVLPAGETSLAVPIAVIADNEIEEAESVTLTLQDPAVAGVELDSENQSATLAIVDNDEAQEEPALLSVVLINDAAEDEQDGAFQVQLSRALTEDLTINYEVTGTATPGADYETLAQQLVLPAGETTMNIVVVVLADTEVEEAETVVLTLQDPATETVTLDQNNQSATLTIADNDEEEQQEPVLLAVAVAQEAAEDEQDGAFSITLSEAFDQDLTISYKLSGTATAGTDYETPAGSVLLAAGETSVGLPIVVIADTEVEEDETVVLELQDPNVAGVALDEANSTATLTIQNDDEAQEEPALLSVVSVADAAEDNEAGALELRLSRALAEDLAVNFTLSGTATAGTDYETPAQEQVIPAGSTSLPIAITPLADTEVEEDET